MEGNVIMDIPHKSRLNRGKRGPLYYLWIGPLLAACFLAVGAALYSALIVISDIVRTYLIAAPPWVGETVALFVLGSFIISILIWLLDFD
jgi:hypothetical protein